MATTTMPLDTGLRDELAEIAKRDFDGVPLAEALRRLIREHRIARVMAQYEALRGDPEERASYRAELALTDQVAGETLPSAADEYPEALSP